MFSWEYLCNKWKVWLNGTICVPKSVPRLLLVGLSNKCSRWAIRSIYLILFNRYGHQAWDILYMHSLHALRQALGQANVYANARSDKKRRTPYRERERERGDPSRGRRALQKTNNSCSPSKVAKQWRNFPLKQTHHPPLNVTFFSVQFFVWVNLN